MCALCYCCSLLSSEIQTDFFFPKYDVNSYLCVRNSFLDIAGQAEHVGTAERMMMGGAPWLLPRAGFWEAGAWS